MASKGKKGAKNNGVILGGILVVGLLLFIAVFSLANKVFQTETYYILNQDVATRTQVAPEMLDPVTTTEGTAPAAAIGLDDVQTGNVYTQFPLFAGDILTMSNVGTMEDISTGIPDNWVVTNFSVGADDAVGGRIQRGSYFDMMVIDEDGDTQTVFYPFVNMLALDTSVDLSSASSAEAVDSEEAKAGQTTQYFVGMSPENAAKLQGISSKYSGKIKLVLSPRQNQYNKPVISDFNKMFAFTKGDDVIWPGKSDKGEITDSTFTPVERDQFGKPKEALENCSTGNGKVSGEDCKPQGTNKDETEAPATE